MQEVATSQTTIHLPAGDLASRASAAVIRNNLLLGWDEHLCITIDCSGVEAMAGSFADELFGIIAKDKGYESTVQKLRLQGASKGVLLSVAGAIRNRRDQTDHANSS